MDLPSLEGRRRRAWVAGRLWFALGGGVRVIVVGELDAAVFVGAVVDAELRGQGLDALGALAHLPRAVVDRACGLASLTVAFVAGRIRVLAAVGLGGALLRQASALLAPPAVDASGNPAAANEP